jgi:hypothetical protein
LLARLEPFIPARVAFSFRSVNADAVITKIASVLKVMFFITCLQIFAFAFNDYSRKLARPG